MLEILAGSAAGIALLSLGLALLLLYKIGKLQKFQKEFFSGSSARDLESVIIESKQQIAKLSSDLKTLTAANRVVAELQQLSIQHVGLVRFNSFADSGGNNSFALALLDDHGDGVVLASLYGRESNRVYAKPVIAGASSIPLTEEEKQAILESRFNAHEK